MCLTHTHRSCANASPLYTGPPSSGVRGPIPVDIEGRLCKEYSRNLRVQRVKDTPRVRTHTPVMSPFQRRRMRDFRTSLKRGSWRPELEPWERRGPHVLSILTLHPLRALMRVPRSFMIQGLWAFHREGETCSKYIECWIDIWRDISPKKMYKQPIKT